MSCYQTSAIRAGVRVYPQSSTALLRFRDENKPRSVEDSRQTRDEYWNVRYWLANKDDVKETTEKILRYGGFIAADNFPLSWKPSWPCQEHRDYAFERLVDLSFQLTIALDGVAEYAKKCGF